MDIDKSGLTRSSHPAGRDALPMPVRDDIRKVSSTDIFRAGEKQISIFHGDSVYSLKMTKQGKLVLNK